MTEQWATIDTAARAVRVKPGTIRQWIVRGKVRADLIARRRVVDLADVRRAEREWRLRCTADLL